MTVMRPVKADGKASVPKPDTTVSSQKDSSRPGSSVGFQPKKKNSSKKHPRKQKPSKKKSNKPSWWTQQDSELVYFSLILLSLAGFFAFDVPGIFYSTLCNQEQPLHRSSTSWTHNNDDQTIRHLDLVRRSAHHACYAICHQDCPLLSPNSWSILILSGRREVDCFLKHAKASDGQEKMLLFVLLCSRWYFERQSFLNAAVSGPRLAM